MKASIQRTLITCGLASTFLLAGRNDSTACGLGTTTITNLPAFALSGYQVYGLGPKGQVTGFFFISGVHGPHAFVYQGGVLSDLGTFGGLDSIGYGVNATGQVAGQADVTSTGETHAFLYNGGSMVDLGTLGGSFSSAAAINDVGQVAGASLLAGGAGPIAFLYANGTIASLGTLGSNYSSAFALNNTGMVVGESGVASSAVHGFVYANGAMTDIGTLGGGYSSAFALNDSGSVVGESSVSAGHVHAFIYSGGSMKDLGTLGGTYSSAFAINTNSQVVGNGTLLNDQVSHGFFYDKGTTVDIGTLGGGNSSIWALNNLGQVVGNADTTNNSTHAFLWTNGTMTDLNALLPTNSGWELVSAQFINDAGRIVGYGNYKGTSLWFVMDPAAPNSPPIASAGPDQIVDCQAQATLDGSGSSDPDKDPLTFAWSLGGSLLGTNVTLTASFPMGTNTVTLTVTDSCGASAQANVVVTVVDTTPPTGSCPASATAVADVNCQAPVPNLVPQVVASDNCTPTGSLVIRQDPPAGTLVNSGSHPITLTVTDTSGNHSSCSVLFTVIDTTPPTIANVPGPMTLSAGANCQASVPNVLSNVVATDNCTPANQLVLGQNPTAGTLVGAGPSTIVVTATDAAGNSSTASIPLNVVDTTPPAFVSVPGALTLSAGANCQASVPNVLSNVVATDNCTPANQLVLSQNPTAGTLVGAGPSTIVVTATDAAGNSSTASIPLNVVDTTPPTIVSVPAGLTVPTGAGCQGTVPNVLLSVVATDNCTAANQLVITQSPAAGTLWPAGQYVLTLTVTDLAGNSASTNVPLTITNSNPPVIQSVTANLNVLNPPNHQLVPVTVSVVLSDTCGARPVSKIVSITSSETISPGDIQFTGDLSVLLAASRDPSGPGRVYTITVQSTNASGNSSTASVMVTVTKGNTSPIISPTLGGRKV